MHVRRQNKLSIGLIFLIAIIVISIGLFFYCSGGSCTSATEETAASSEEEQQEQMEQAEQEDIENKYREKRVPSSDSDSNTTEDTPSNDDQNQY